jgi:hypothetical protein
VREKLLPSSSFSSFLLLKKNIDGKAKGKRKERREGEEEKKSRDR